MSVKLNPLFSANTMLEVEGRLIEERERNHIETDINSSRAPRNLDRKITAKRKAIKQTKKRNRK